MPESNLEDQIPVAELSENQKYVNEKVAALLDQIGDEYGESLTQQLVQRLDTTVTDFHEEVTNMLSELKEKTVSRQQKLRDAWDHRFDNQPQQVLEDLVTESSPKEDSTNSSADDSSEWEKRLETMESGKKPEASEKESSVGDKKKKKKGLFGRKKK